MKDSPIYTGGLFRCCIQAVENDPGPDEIGREIVTPCCKTRLRYETRREGLIPAWRWVMELKPREG